MSGNSFGTLFKVTSFGESHGPALGCVIDGCPPGFALNESLIQPFLDKRKPGTSRHTSQRREEDAVEILSGVFEGKTTGAPIALLIKNSDARSKDYQDLKEVFRPGHADFTFHHKYGHRDYRGGGRASARETVARVAAGAVAALYLQEKLQLQIIGYLEQIGDLVLDFENAQQILENPFFCPNNKQIALLEDKIETLRRAGDSTGAQIRIVVKNMPIGLGDPVFDKLDASLAYALMSIPAVKGVEIGSGFAAVRQLGSEHRDEQNAAGFLSNHAGGVLGGISTGQDLELRIAVKPTSSIVKPGLTLDIHGQETSVSVKGRHDPCAGIRAVPIAEAMVALVLMDHYLRDRAQNF